MRLVKEKMWSRIAKIRGEDITVFRVFRLAIEEESLEEFNKSGNE